MEPLVAEQVRLGKERDELIQQTGVLVSLKIILVYTRLAEIERLKVLALPTICDRCPYR